VVELVRELASHFGDTPAGWVSDRASFDDPVQDHLVDRVRHWPGVNGLAALLAGRSLRARRPRHFFRPDGPMPDELWTRGGQVPELRLSTPPLHVIHRATPMFPCQLAVT
jgi:hypothetical protein